MEFSWYFIVMFMWKTRCYAENFRNYLLKYMARKIKWKFWEFWAVENFTLFLRNQLTLRRELHKKFWLSQLSPTTTLIIFHPPNIPNMWWWYHFHSTFFLLLSVNPENSSTSNAHKKNDLAIKLREEKLGNFVISHKLIGKSFPISCLRDGRRFVWESVGAWMMN